MVRKLTALLLGTLLLFAAPAFAIDLGTLELGTIQLNGQTSGLLKLTVPGNAGSATFTFFTVDGSSGNCVETNGSATLSFQGCANLTASQTFSGSQIFTSGTITFGGSMVVPTRTVTLTGAQTLSATTDYFLCINRVTGAPTAVALPAAPATGLTFLVKDCKGDAATNNITITPNAGTIDSAGTFVMNTNFQSISLTYNGVGWSVN